MKITTNFDVNKNHIVLDILVKNKLNTYNLTGILDTGAPQTEFSDKFLKFSGLIENNDASIESKNNLQTQRYNRVNIPEMDICGIKLKNHLVYVASFEDSWGIDILVGLDFFRENKVTIDYSVGKIISESIK